MKRVLRRLGFLTKDNIIDVKGRVAAEINAADELITTELLFSGFFTDLTPQQVAAVLSIFVFDEKVASFAFVNVRSTKLTAGYSADGCGQVEA